MATVADRVADWVDVVAELLVQPLAVYPVEEVTAQLGRTFDSPSVSFNWRTRDGVPGLEIPASAGELIADRPAPEVRALAQEGLQAGLLEEHPLLRWFAV